MKGARKKETAFQNEDKENNRNDMEEVRKREKNYDHFWSESETESGEDENTSKPKEKVRKNFVSASSKFTFSPLQ